ncbi:hypothetical protein BDR05DRAFT_997063 [Suillus weaverae]|nr:hypothetical protein BDR05DRAFT_997063 [Suillus weaverae]
MLSPVSSPLLPHSRPLTSPFIPSGRTAITSLHVSVTPSSCPASAGSFLRGSTPLSDAVGSHASSVTPASSVFELTHRPSVHPAKKNNQPAFRTPELPTTHPSQAGFSTGNEVVQRHPAASGTANQQSATAFANPQVHTTVFSDRLANLDSTVLDLAAKVDRLSLQCRSAVLEPQVQYLIEENDILRATVDKHHISIKELQKTGNAQHNSLQELLTLINTRRQSESAVLSVNSVEKATKAVRDNTFNTAIRQTFLHAMGISDSKLAATLESLEEGAVVLCPNFDSSWTENAAWREDMIRYVRQKACDVYRQLREEHLKKKNDADITKQLKEVFKNMKDVIKKGGKGTDATEARNRKQRQNAQKVRKNNERAAEDVRKETKTNNPEWDWFYQACYQSTDKSDTGLVAKPSVDFESDTENARKRPTKSKNIDATWTSRPPSYRDTLVNEKVVQMNVLVSKKRVERGGRNFSVPVIRGEAHEKDLPQPGNGKPKILRRFVCPEWLTNNSAQDGPTQIYRKDESEESITDVLVDGTRDLAHPPTDYDGTDGGTEAYDGDEEGLKDDEGNMRESAGTNDADFDEIYR